MKPAITVIVLTHNRAKYLLRCLSSIEAQVFDKQIEVLVVADSCTDNTISMLKMWQKLGGDYRSIVNLANAGWDSPAGIGYASHIGVKLAKGEYICRLDDDDWYSKYFMAVMYSAIIDSKQDGVYCYVDQHNEDGIIGEKGKYPMACNILWRRQAVLDAGNYNINCKRDEDTDLLGRMKPPKSIPIALYRYWQHKKGE